MWQNSLYQHEKENKRAHQANSKKSMHDRNSPGLDGRGSIPSMRLFRSPTPALLYPVTKTIDFFLEYLQRLFDGHFSLLN
jgi:hypothetical protein